MVDGRRQRVASVDFSDDSSDSDEGESFFAQEPLPEETFHEGGLRDHLDGHHFDIYSEFILQEVLESHRYQKIESIFETDTSDDEGDHDVYEIDKDGAPRAKIRGDSNKVVTILSYGKF